MKDHRLSTQLLGPPIDTELFPFGTDTIRGYDDCDHDPIGCRSWLVVLAIGIALPVCIAIGARALREEPYQATGAAYVRAIHAAHPELNTLGPDQGAALKATSSEPKGGAANSNAPTPSSHHLPAPAPRLAGGWHPCSITTYGHSYHGKRTASGSRYDDEGWTVAVPMKGRKPAIPFGTKIDLKWKGRTLAALVVTDVCPAGTFDVTAKAMRKVLGRYEDTKLRGASWRVSE